MNKKSAAKITKFLIPFLSLSFLLFSCDSPSNSNVVQPVTEKETTSVRDLYAAMIGTWVKESDNSDTITITPDSITYTWASEEFNFNVSKLVTLKEMISFAKEAGGVSYLEDGETLVDDYVSFEKQINNNYSDTDVCFYELYDGRVQSYILLKKNGSNLNVLKASRGGVNHNSNSIYTKKASSNSNTASDITASDLAGSYTIQEANGSAFSFSPNGTWTYDYKNQTTKGTWKLSDGELIMSFTLASYTNTGVFTVSVSGSTYTLTGKSGDYITIISSAFKITDQNSLENSVVTLVKQ